MKRIIVTICLITIFLPAFTGSAFTLPKHDYPRIANLYWRAPIAKKDIPTLAKWDVLVLDMSAQTVSASAIRKIRQINPKIIILAYTTSNEILVDQLKIKEPSGRGIWHNLSSGGKEDWQLKTYDDKNVVFWPGNIMMNPVAKDSSNKTYNDHLVDFFVNEILNTELWDGLFFDNIWNEIYWVDSKTDIDNDNRPDSKTKVDNLWQAGHQDFFNKLRKKLGDKYLIIINGTGSYHDYANGRMFESFPEYWEGRWLGSIKNYQLVNSSGYNPRINIINSDADNTSNQSSYQKMRFGLASTLLFDGYYSFDYGPNLREQLWWYDEYDLSLGQPKSQPINLLNKENKNLSESLWQRDFTNGLVILNSTNQSQYIKFDSEYEKIHGTQDTKINNGSIINSITVSANDAVILLRPINEIKNAIFSNGSFARIFDNNGKNIRTGFFSYDQKFRGSTKLIKTDINNDGKEEIIMANDNKIEIYKYNYTKIKTFYPYGQGYAKGISIALADFDHDNKLEIITGTEKGGSNLVKIFDNQGNTIHKGFNAYHYLWTNLGVNVAVGDINGDGEIEIITGTSMGGGPHVRIFDRYGKILSNGFFAYSTNFRGGVNVAVGDINGDGIDEIVTGAGFTGGPHVRIFNNQGNLIGQFFAYDKKNREGVQIAVSDLDNDGKDEIIALTTNVFTTSFFKKLNPIKYARQ